MMSRHMFSQFLYLVELRTITLFPAADFGSEKTNLDFSKIVVDVGYEAAASSNQDLTTSNQGSPLDEDKWKLPTRISPELQNSMLDGKLHVKTAASTNFECVYPRPLHSINAY